MAISSVSDGNAAAASDLNQYKNALEGAATSTWLLKAASTTHFQVQLADNAGSYELKVLDSDGIAVARIDSNGNLTLSGSFSPGTLVLPTASAPSQTAEGSTAWDTDDDVLTVGTGSATKRVSPYVAAGASPAVKGEIAHNTTTGVTYIHNGTTVVPIGTRLYKYLSVAQNFTTSTYANINADVGTDMTFAILANTTYLFTFDFTVTATGTAGSGGLKVQITFPTTPTKIHFIGDYPYSAGDSSIVGIVTGTKQYVSGSTTSGTTLTLFSSLAANAGSANGVTVGRGNIVILIRNGSTAGNVVFQAAQNTAAGTTTIGAVTIMQEYVAAAS